MTPPSISCICLAYGCSKQLNEAVACFLSQDYEKKELIILNSFPRQTFTGEFPGVKIINLPIRPDSLGACRNMAISRSSGDVIVVWDADDLYLPHHLRVIGECFEHTTASWVRVNPVYYAEKYKIVKPFTTWINSVSFRREAWEKCGKYPHTLSVGEDQALWKSLNQLNGVTFEANEDAVSAIYCWDTGTFHISGQGWDKQGQVPAYERARLDLERRIKCGEETIGKIEIKPAFEHDPRLMVKEYLDRPRPVIKKNSVCLIELGRYGDIINILPIARHIAETYDTPHMMVSREFASVLDGVSYVHPHVVPLRNDQLHEAVAIAHNKFKHVINCQIWGANWPQTRNTASFNRESWTQAGFGYKFDDYSAEWLPYFDRRDRSREALLVNKISATGKPLLLVNLTRGISSPFKRGPEVLSFIRDTFGNDYQIVDLGELRLERIYDVLGLMDVAAALVSIDTSLLHLAAASDVPYIALVNDQPWLGSELRGHCVARIHYSYQGTEFLEKSIRKALAEPRSIRAQNPIRNAPQRLIYHCCERHESHIVKEMKRKQVAWTSWDALYRTGQVIPCHYWAPYKRDAREIGDNRALPYLKDCLQFAMQQARDDDIIMWTNDDNVLHPLLPDLVQLHCSLWEMCCSQRCEMHNETPKTADTPDAWASKGSAHMGRDLFAFTKIWLKQHWDEIPDFILGASDFDLMLASMIRLRWGIASNRKNMEETIWPCELPRGYVAHEYHFPRWNDAKNVDAAPSQRTNRGLFYDWAQIHLPSLHFSPNKTI